MEVKCSVKPLAKIDEKHRVVDVVFPTEFCEKSIGEASVSRRIEPYMGEIVGLGIDRGVQPITLNVEVDHGFVERDVIRLVAAGRL
jgi:hypothetical protein